MDSQKIYDIAVIGGGSAGYAAARTAHSLGLDVLVFDGSERLAGLCILEGCMPSKSLIETANRNRVIRNAGDFGIEVPPSSVDVKKVRDRKRFYIDDFANFRSGQLEDGRFKLVRSNARFTEHPGPDSPVQLESHHGEQRWQAKKVIIASGSIVHIPEIQGLKETGFWTSSDLLDAESLADSWIVLGGGAIALELAHYLEGIGRKVSVIQRSEQLLRGQDVDVAKVIEEDFIERGIAVHTGTELLSFHKNEESNLKSVKFSSKITGEVKQVEAAEILLALGRSPASHSLNVEAVSLEKNKSDHIQVNLHQKTSHPDIFAAGDITGEIEVVHIAIQQAEIAAKNAAAELRGEAAELEMDYRCKLFGIFTEPQIATVGLNEVECQAQKIPYLTASYPFNDHGKSMLMGTQRGFVKMLANPESGEVLGASVVGPEATEIIHEIVVAMHYRSTVKEFSSIPHYHPTLSEIWTYPSEEIMDMMEV